MLFSSALMSYLYEANFFFASIKPRGRHISVSHPLSREYAPSKPIRKLHTSVIFVGNVVVV